MLDQKNHIVPLYFVQDLDDTAQATVSDYISMKNYDHACVVFITGTVATPDVDITVNASDDVSGTHETTLSTIKYRTMVTSDTWSALSTVTDSKLDWVNGGEIEDEDNAMFCIEIDAADLLSVGHTYVYDCFSIGIADPSGQAVYIAAICILSKGRYKEAIPLTAIAD